MTGERLAAISHAVFGVGDGVNGPAEVELAPVGARGVPGRLAEFDFRDLKMRPRTVIVEREPEMFELPVVGERVLPALTPRRERRFIGVLVEQRPVPAVVRAFQRPRFRVAIRQVVAGGEGIGRHGHTAGAVANPHDRLVVMFEAPFGVGRAVNAGLDRLPAGRGLATGAFRGRQAVAAQVDEHVAERLIRPRVLFVANPEGVFVELDLLPLDAAKDHRAEPTVADRQGLLFPIPGRFVVPEGGVRRHRADSQRQPENQIQFHHLFTSDFTVSTPPLTRPFTGRVLSDATGSATTMPSFRSMSTANMPRESGPATSPPPAPATFSRAPQPPSAPWPSR